MSGQLFGLGMDMKKTRQLIRMDHHTPAPDHGGEKRKKHYEINTPRDCDEYPFNASYEGGPQAMIVLEFH